jgi:saccharopine dehydrogenase (NAD+, L-lysine-forming)
MAKVLVIGAGGVGSVAVHKMAMNPDIFGEVVLASRTKQVRCDRRFGEAAYRRDVATYQIDADDVAATTALIREVKPALVVNLALPYQDLAIMDACLAAGVNYMDTANYEPREEAKFEYKWQWAYQESSRPRA